MPLSASCGGSSDSAAGTTPAADASPTQSAVANPVTASPTAGATSNAVPSPTTPPPTSAATAAAPSPTTAAAPTAPAPTQTPPPTQVPAPTPRAQPAARSVAVAGLSFTPAALTVVAGSVVTWTWSGVDFHNVAGSAFDSGSPVTNGTFSFTFTTAGTYSYVCEVHTAAGMTGTVTVQ